MNGLVVLALCVRALVGDDPSEVPPPPPPTEEAPIEAPTPSTTAPVSDERTVVHEAADASRARCKELIADGKLDDARACLRELAADKEAQALLDVLDAWQTRPTLTPAAVAPPPPQPVRAQVSWMRLVESGKAEGLLHGTLAGAGGGFLAAATYFSTTRATEGDSLPWLIASPAAGALAGAAGTWFLLDGANPSNGAISLGASTMWNGAAEGFMLQLAVFDQNYDASSVPLRFATVFGGGLLGLGSGIGLSQLADGISPGDVAVANSAALWGGVLSGFALSYVASAVPGTQITLPQGVFVIMAGSLLPYGIALACHPLIDIGRWPSWLIEGGGVAGLLLSSAATGLLLASLGGGNTSFAVAFIGLGTAAGVAVGGGAAYLVSEATRAPSTPNAPADEGSAQATVVPTVLLDDNGRAAPGLALVGQF